MEIYTRASISTHTHVHTIVQLIHSTISFWNERIFMKNYCLSTSKHKSFQFRIINNYKLLKMEYSLVYHEYDKCSMDAMFTMRITISLYIRLQMMTNENWQHYFVSVVKMCVCVCVLSLYFHQINTNIENLPHMSFVDCYNIAITPTTTNTIPDNK